MLKHLMRPKELREAETELSGAADWLSIWSVVVLPLTLLAGLLYLNNHLPSTIQERAATKAAADSVAYEAEHHMEIKEKAHAKFMEELVKSRAAEGWCDTWHYRCD